MKTIIATLVLLLTVLNTFALTPDDFKEFEFIALQYEVVDDELKITYTENMEYNKRFQHFIQAVRLSESFNSVSIHTKDRAGKTLAFIKADNSTINNFIETNSTNDLMKNMKGSWYCKKYRDHIKQKCEIYDYLVNN